MAAPHSKSPASASAMKINLLKIATTCAFALMFSAAAFGQSNTAPTKQNGAITQVANFAGQVTVIVVKSAGQAAWATTKFSAKNIAKPLLFKAVPAVSKFAYKLTGKAIKKGIPVASKLGFTYLKAKLPF